jgi:electron transport complex protein RnfG
MKEILKLGGILLLVAAIAGGALSIVNAITKPRIELQKRLVLERALVNAIPAANKNAIVPMEENGIEFYKGYVNSDTTGLAGYAFVAYGKGYSSTIETMVGVDTLFSITGLSIMHQVETPGLGTKIEEIKYGEDSPWFQDQFLKRPWNKLVVDKDGGDIVSITGATISSRAVANSIKEGLEQLEKHLKRN